MAFPLSLYLLELYRYIELNPVRAGMVDESAGYRWSSYRFNASGKNQHCVGRTVCILNWVKMMQTAKGSTVVFLTGSGG